MADCLKELRSLFRDMATHLPKVTVTLQFSGITVQDEKSQVWVIPINQSLHLINKYCHVVVCLSISHRSRFPSVHSSPSVVHLSTPYSALHSLCPLITHLFPPPPPLSLSLFLPPNPHSHCPPSMQLETLKAPLDHISYVCLDPADSSIFSFIIRSPDTISSKGLRLHAFMTDPQTVSGSVYTAMYVHVHNTVHGMHRSVLALSKHSAVNLHIHCIGSLCSVLLLLRFCNEAGHADVCTSDLEWYTVPCAYHSSIQYHVSTIAVYSTMCLP